jgi:hypothetical protein|nr:MAG TPA: hypothetical protein [Caudoviricetes sp.]
MGKLVVHEKCITIDDDFLSLEDCFEAFRRSVEYAESHGIEDTLVISSSIDTVEFQRANGNSVLVTYDDVHKVIIMRIFLNEGDAVIKPIYIYNRSDYQVSCNFMRSVLGGNLDLKKEWLI